MKLRLSNNAIRVRIQKQELEDLAALGSICESISFGATPATRLTYQLNAATNVKALDINFTDQCIVIVIPMEVVLEMVDTDRVGIHAEKHINEGEVLSVLVEKDFKCLTPRAEDAGAFPHPEAASGHTC